MKFCTDTAAGTFLKSAPRPLCAGELRNLLTINPKATRNLVLLCIGTDRIIGDSLGPLVGTMLRQTHNSKTCGADHSQLPYQLAVYGTLQHTVHALNLSETALHIQKNHPDSIIIAIDASLGSREDIGSVFVRSGNLHPGAGVHKDLPQLGDISITGIAGEQSRHPYLTLQTVRLSTIMQMAETICSCIQQVCM